MIQNILKWLVQSQHFSSTTGFIPKENALQTASIRQLMDRVNDIGLANNITKAAKVSV